MFWCEHIMATDILFWSKNICNILILPQFLYIRLLNYIHLYLIGPKRTDKAYICRSHSVSLVSQTDARDMYRICTLYVHRAIEIYKYLPAVKSFGYLSIKNLFISQQEYDKSFLVNGTIASIGFRYVDIYVLNNVHYLLDFFHYQNQIAKTW